MKKIVVVFMIALVWVMPVFAQDGELPDSIDAMRPGFFPEGIEWDAENEMFLLGSLTEGTVFGVADDGTVTPLVEDEMLAASVGIEIDEENNRLLAASGTPTAFFDEAEAGFAGLGAYDMETGEQLFYVDLGALTPESAKHFANDVTVDAEGNAYVTDTFAGVIYLVDPEGAASIFAELGAGLNGIAYHEDGYLLVVVAGGLSKVPLDDPTAATPVETDVVVNGDGIIFTEEGDLVVVGGMTDAEGNSAGGVMWLTSEDEWATATLTGFAPVEGQASTAAIRDGEVYIIYPGFEFMGGSEVPESSLIERAEFEAVE